LRYEKEFSFLFKTVYVGARACARTQPERPESKFILRRTLFNRLKEQEHQTPTLFLSHLSQLFLENQSERIIFTLDRTKIRNRFLRSTASNQ